MSINKTEPHLISNHQDTPFRGSLSFITGVSSGEQTQAKESQAVRDQADKELGKLQEELLLLIGELEEFVLDDE